MKLLLAIAAAIAFASPAAAQMDMSMPAMKMPAEPVVKPTAKPVRRGGPTRAAPPRQRANPAPISISRPAPPAADMPGMDMTPAAPSASGQTLPVSPERGLSSMPGMEMGEPSAPAVADDKASDDKSGVAGVPSMEPQDSEIGNTPAPAPPTDHAADALFGAAQMADSRKMLRHENGGMPAYSILFNLAEYRVQKGGDAYRWDGEGWFGGDINRLVVKTEGQGAVCGGVESAEVQALYSRAIDPWFNLQVGVRHDIKPGPSRTYATVGFEGIAPYWFEVAGALFLSDKGDLLARLEGYYNQRITQKLILQPRVELNFAAQDVSTNGIGSGLSDAELGLRLRYEIKREFAPYIGISWERKVGDTARFALAAGDRVQATSFVLGIRTWF